MKKSILIGMAVLAAAALLTQASCGHDAKTPETTATPEVSAASAAKTSAPQESVDFTLTMINTGPFESGSVWKVYTTATGGSASSVVTASVGEPTLVGTTLTQTLTLTKAGGITVGKYWVTVTEPDKEESARLELTVSSS